MGLVTLDPTKGTQVAFRGIANILQGLVTDAATRRNLVKNVAEVATKFRHWTWIEIEYSLNNLEQTSELRSNSLKKVVRRVEDLYEAILQFQVVISKECQHGGVGRFFHAPETMERMNALVEQVKTHHGTCETELNLCKSQFDRSLKIKEWISETKYESSHGNIVDKIKLKEYPDCAKWLLSSDQYAKWWSQQSGVLWIKGTVGTGKTTLMARII
ncbi:hypothetical protein FB567DRAFT_203573 [Paraphoma chrysanthemicola]|uniref:Nephrocystin 3-like N-terminal domain-containing protein n=1 Tax=Paraphoma chrysanthemicola TaxID=798071 RepID=A0A8K0VSY7_9PLEO|nr:hypothetical protein FB567DRAFT_203573 [Paraphoma chrysanthemicola]